MDDVAEIVEAIREAVMLSQLPGRGMRPGDFDPVAEALREWEKSILRKAGVVVKD